MENLGNFGSKINFLFWGIFCEVKLFFFLEMLEKVVVFVNVIVWKFLNEIWFEFFGINVLGN